MAKIQRPKVNVSAFASRAAEGERAAFGTDTDTTDISQHINPNYLRGFKSVYGPDDIPEKKDFSGLNFAAGVMTAYLYQAGVPEWNSNQEYHLGSLSRFGEAVFVSKTDDNIGNSPLGDNGGFEWALGNSVSLSVSDVSSVVSLDSEYAVTVDVDGGLGHVLSTVGDSLSVVNYDGFELQFDGVDPDGVEINSIDYVNTTNLGQATGSFNRFGGIVSDNLDDIYYYDKVNSVITVIGIEGDSQVLRQQIQTARPSISSGNPAPSSYVELDGDNVLIYNGSFPTGVYIAYMTVFNKVTGDIINDYTYTPASNTLNPLAQASNDSYSSCYLDGRFFIPSRNMKSMLFNDADFDYSSISDVMPTGLSSSYKVIACMSYQGNLLIAVEAATTGNSFEIYSVDIDDLKNNGVMTLSLISSVNTLASTGGSLSREKVFYKNTDDSMVIASRSSTNNYRSVFYYASPVSQPDFIFDRANDLPAGYSALRLFVPIKGYTKGFNIAFSPTGSADATERTLLLNDGAFDSAISTSTIEPYPSVFYSDNKLYSWVVGNSSNNRELIVFNNSDITGIPPAHISMCGSGSDRLFITDGAEIQCYEVSKSQGTASMIGNTIALESVAGDIGGVNVEICYLSGENMPNENSDYIILYSDRAEKIVCLEFDGLGFSVFDDAVLENVGSTWSQVSNASRSSSQVVFNNRDSEELYLIEATAGGVFNVSLIGSNSINGMTNPVLSEGVGNSFLLFGSNDNYVTQISLQGTSFNIEGTEISVDGVDVVRAIIVDSEKRIISNKDKDFYSLYINKFVPRETDDWALLSSNGFDVNLGSMAFAGKSLNEAIKAIATEVKYFVGCIYKSTRPDSPADVLGFGSWQRIEGRYLFGISDTDNDFRAGAAGGSKTHDHATLYDLQQSAMSATIRRDGWGALQSGGSLPEPTTVEQLVTGSGDTENAENLESLAHAAVNKQVDTDGHTHSGVASVNESSNLPPSKGVYMWIRTG